MLGSAWIPASPRFAVPITRKGRVVKPRLPYGVITREQNLPIVMLTRSESAKYWPTKAGLEPVLNVEGAVVEAVEFGLVAKHRCGMHLAFDKGKSTP